MLFYAALFFLCLTGVSLYLTRGYWVAVVRDQSQHLYARLPGTTAAAANFVSASFTDDAEAGLSSRHFDLAGNITNDQETRGGLDDAAKAQILRLMKKRRVTFDEARHLYMQSRFQDNGITEDGIPRDPKFVSF